MNKYLIVGLGNPGADYEFTRHNIGFEVVNQLVADAGGSFELTKLGWISHIKISGKQVIVVKPNTYMNLSGKAVLFWMIAEKIKPENILVVTDDLALPTAKIRLREKGSPGGHNGLKSIVEMLGHEQFPRLRFGVGSNFQKGRQVEYVLNKFKPDETADVTASINTSVEAIKSFVKAGISNTMTIFNR